MSEATFEATEAKYQELLGLLSKKQEHLNVQKFLVKWKMTLHQHLVEEDNVLSLDMHDGNRLIGVWLKKRDYGAKIKRKAAITALLQKQHEEDRESWRDNPSMSAPGVPWGPEKVKTFGKQWDRSDYVRFMQPLYPPTLWLKAVLTRC